MGTDVILSTNHSQKDKSQNHLSRETDTSAQIIVS